MKRRTVTKFLWMPKIIDFKVKWLVTATWIEEYGDVLIIDGWHSEYTIKDWYATKWV